ncbi:GntR family transcriptional regulator [Roseicella aquatilis]|uniref:GntR family transcriptional regulator n=1 Tax=Roseicella aquatilis TaxID=2527868 RepID=A0A4R4DTT2_9PROT|nr:GntR family transcriptional regulator [Roseicella aquatilis]TCZ63540.1 GntR family transcriptional regulator [Roseicella aquatilis]
MLPGEETKSGTSSADRLVGRTLASDVLHRLRTDLLNSLFLPGDRLRFEPLRERYQVSFSTLREALASLVQEGLVVAEGQRGFRVAPVSRADLIDLLETRIIVEREALRLALQRGTPASRARVTEDFLRMNEAREQAEASGRWTSPEWCRLHWAFHDSLVADCGSATLLDIRARLWKRSERYRSLARRLRPVQRGPVSDHRDIYESAMAGDAVRTHSLLEGQFRRGAEHVLRHAAAMLAAE